VCRTWRLHCGFWTWGCLLTKLQVGWCGENCSQAGLTSQENATGDLFVSAGTETALVEGSRIENDVFSVFLDVGDLVTKLQVGWCSGNCKQELFTSEKSATGNLSLFAGTAFAQIDGYHVKNDVFNAVFGRFIYIYMKRLSTFLTLSSRLCYSTAWAEVTLP